MLIRLKGFSNTLQIEREILHKCVKVLIEPKVTKVTKVTPLFKSFTVNN